MGIEGYPGNLTGGVVAMGIVEYPGDSSVVVIFGSGSDKFRQKSWR
jgi:hypothetical protein